MSDFLDTTQDEEPATEQAVRAAMARMLEMNFLIEPPLALPMELPL